MAAGDVYELRLNWLQANQKLATVMHAVQHDGDGTGDGRTAVLGVWGDNLQVPLLALLSSELLLASAQCRKIKPTKTQPFFDTVNDPGTISSEALPPNSCYLINTYGQTTGRKGNGRMYIPGVPRSAQNNGRILSSFVTGLQTWANLLNNVYEGDPSGFHFKFCVYSYADLTARIIRISQLETEIRTLRSRTVGVGS